MYISDSHTDFLTILKDKNARKNYLSQCKNQGVRTLGCAVFTLENNYTVKDIRMFKNELLIWSQEFEMNLLLTIEDLGFIKTYQDLDALIDLRPFSVTLTWNFENQFAGGAKTKLGLSALGKSTLSLLERNNILIDTAHLSRRSFYEVADLSGNPLFNSHSNIDEICSHDRNLTNDQIKQIASTGGFLGITLYDKFIADERIDSRSIAKQFDFLNNQVGLECVGFGTDFYGVDFSNLPVDIKNYYDFFRIRKHLKSMGYNDKLIEKIMHKNFEDFYALYLKS